MADVMTDFNIRRGLSTVLFSEPGVINPDLLIEEGCWYLCTDTAELFLGVSTEDGLSLKRINDRNPADIPTDVPTVGEAARTIIDAFINEETGMLHLIYSDDTEDILGPVVGKDGQDGKDGVNGTNGKDGIDGKNGVDGKDGLTTAVQVNGVIYNHENGIITLPGFITEHQDLSAYATTEFVVNELNKIETPEAEIYKVDFNAPDFAAAIEAYNSGKLLILANAAPDANGYAVMNYVREDKITFTKFLMSRSETYGAFNTYYLSPDNTWEVSKEVKLNKVEITDDGNLQVGKQVFEVPSVDGLATETFVHEMIAKAELEDKEADLEAYYTKDQVDALIPSLEGYAKTEDIPTDYLRASDLEGYSKFSGSYNDLTDKPEIPGDLATESFVNEAIAKIELTPGKDGVDGQDGKNGITPHIGANGNWFIGDEDTGVKAQGIDGTNGKDGQDGTQGEKGETGAQGPAGKDFTFDMFTIEQLESLKVKGDPGQDGKDGADGKDFTFDMFTEEQLNLLKGETGAQGDQGPRGADGKDGLTTSVKIGEALYNHENGIIALPEFSAKIPFTAAKLVNNPIGDFKVGDDLVGMSIAEILTKLLGLSNSEIVDPDVPVDPEEPNNLPIYQITETGELVELPYVANIYTPSEATGLPKELKTGFYQVKDGDTVIESGYEHYTEQQAMYYMVALPSEYRFGENIEIKAWDNGLKSWNTVSASAFTCEYTKIEEALALANIAAPQVPDGYTLWADLSDINSGMQYRFIIKEEDV